MLVPIRAPLLIVTGIRRAGLNLLADMLRSGSIPDARIVIAPDPHTSEAPPIIAPSCLGLFVDRTSVRLLESMERQNAQEGRAPLSLPERRTLKLRLVRDLRRARQHAVEHFAPLYVFEFEKLVDDPAREAARLSHILTPHYPEFSPAFAALAVRRVYHSRTPRTIKGIFRVVKP